jgi:hypothetical protein
MPQDPVVALEVPDPATIAQVATLLAAAGLPASPAEVLVFAKAYLGFRKGIESLYAIPGCRYELPALNFTAIPVYADWA